MASNSSSNPAVDSAFREILDDFKQSLKKRDQSNFQMTTIEELKQSIVNMQAAQ